MIFSSKVIVRTHRPMHALNLLLYLDHILSEKNLLKLSP